MRRSLIAVVAGVCVVASGPMDARARHRHLDRPDRQDAPTQIPTPYAGPPVEDGVRICDEQHGCRWKQASLVPVDARVERRPRDATASAINAGDGVAPAIEAVRRVGAYAVIKTREGTGRVVAWAGERFQGLIRDLQAAGYRIGGPGCLSAGHMRHSKHHWGGACDFFGQYARDKTRLRQPAPELQIALAQKHGLISGCMWRDRDCGHFEVPTHGQSVAQYMAVRGYARRHGRRYATR